MADQTASTGQTTTPPGGDELYNMLMAQIEPELMTDQLPLLDEKYKNETPEQSKKRAERYEKAFKRYEKDLAEYLGTLSGKVHEYRVAARQSAEEEQQSKDSAQISGLEQAISGQ